MQTKRLTGTDSQAVELRVRDLLLSALTVSSGAVDAISFLALGKVFSAFMTGNVAFLGFRAAGARTIPIDPARRGCMVGGNALTAEPEGAR